MDLDQTLGGEGSRQPLFQVVHDPPTDRFFLREITDVGKSHPDESLTIRNLSSPFPLEQVVLPPHSRRSNRETEVVDTNTQQQQQHSPTKRCRSPNKYLARASKLHADRADRLQGTQGDFQPGIRWDGEPVHVKVSGIAAFDSISKPHSRHRDYLDPIVVASKTHGESIYHENGQWLTHTYELKQLARIRPSADGFRDRNVNIDCTFTPMAYLSESESEPDVMEEDEEEASSSDESLPIFNRGDRVKFRLSGSLEDRIGRVISRIHRSAFYDIQSHEGHVFKSVYAGTMTLLPPRERRPKAKPRHEYAKNEKVLWLPPPGEDPMYNGEDSSGSDNNDEELNSTPRATTYKARIVRVRSFERFDLLLRTGHVIKRVPYAQLRPRTGFSLS